MVVDAYIQLCMAVVSGVQVGFEWAWDKRDYQLIVKVAEHLPESALQEAPGLLMYYDNALMRAESEAE